jgi:hypothetical protein
MKDKPSGDHAQIDGSHESIIRYVFFKNMGVGFVPVIGPIPSSSESTAAAASFDLHLSDSVDRFVDGFFLGGASSSAVW